MANNNRKRRDGTLAFSSAGRAIADRRVVAPDGRIQRLCGPSSAFSTDFTKLILDDYQGILEQVHLETELKGARDVIRALQLAPNDPECFDLLQRMQSNPAERLEANLLCPIWRYEHSIKTSYIATQRYIFPEVSDELYLLTIIHDYAENLEVLEGQIKSARKSLDDVIRKMNKKRRGVMMFGAFEPDLRSEDEFTSNRTLSKAVIELGWQVADHGGWVLSSHFMIRVPHGDDFLNQLQKEFPANGWLRVQLKPIRKDEVIAATVMKILGYVAKFKKPLFKIPTRGAKLIEADNEMHQMRNVFLGAAMRDTYGASKQFDLNAARRQWALFIDRMGLSSMYFSVESVHAQKWQSQSEMQYLTTHGSPEEVHGFNRREVHRDTGPFSRHRIDPSVKRFVTRRSTRPLQYDPEWVESTNLDGYDPSMHVIPRHR